MNRQEIDIKLVQDAKRSDQRAFNNLFKYYYLQTFRFIRHYVNDPMEAEDLTMITFEKAFSKIHSYYPFNTFRSWLFRIAHNVSITYIRKYKYELVELPMDLISKIENPEQIYINKEREERLNFCIESLQSNYKEVIYLHLDNVPGREVSKRLGISPIVARSHLFRARKKLLKLLA